MKNLTQKKILIGAAAAVVVILLLVLVLSPKKSTGSPSESGNTTVESTDSAGKTDDSTQSAAQSTEQTTEQTVEQASENGAATEAKQEAGTSSSSAASTADTKKYKYKDMAEAAEGRREDIRPEIEANGVTMDLQGSGNEMFMYLTLNTYMPGLVAKATLKAVESDLDAAFQELIDELDQQVAVDDPVLHAIVYNTNGKQLWTKDYYPSK